MTGNPSPQIQALLDAVAAGQIAPEVAAHQLQTDGFAPVADFAKLDVARQDRTGFPEVIWGADKTADQIVGIMMEARSHQSVVMATRVSTAKYQQVKASVRDLRYYPEAQICAIGQPDRIYPGKLMLITAGTADLPVAEEAAITAELMGFTPKRLWDVGVAGVHRLLHHQAQLQDADVIIVVAGMEGALPSVVAGLVDCPVVAVPTSVGYGAHLGGLTPLMAMLTACATGIGVVNIDNGFGAAMLAGQILRTAGRLAKKIQGS
ncbi:MAG: nickel pincer cofactor biosynthesis protein LarB [Spirulina sp. SIO3F2]|nr:nickel pincer cofactor biosynthesis protein LarB [Spirulina sp. SIO3F2]